jgi:prevent-host-death family protein
MKRASITEAKNSLSALIDRVRHGQAVIIEDRGVPVARLESVAGDERGRSEGRLARLERQGLARRPSARTPSQVLAAPPPRVRRGRTLSAALLAERAESR